MIASGVPLWFDGWIMREIEAESMDLLIFPLDILLCSGGVICMYSMTKNSLH